MMSEIIERLKDPSFILDAAQVTVAIAVAAILALDITGIWSGPTWLSNNVPSITLIAVCTLIVSAFLEKRIQLEKFIASTENKLDELTDKSASGIVLQDRQGFTVPFETILANAREVNFMGENLGAVLPSIATVIKARAKAGCKFRILITHPGYTKILQQSGYIGKGFSTAISLTILEHLISNSRNIEVRFMKLPPPFSLLIVDPKQIHGSVQVEFYTCIADPSSRPHFTLTQSTDKHWYDFYANEFEQTWQNAQRSNEILAEHISQDVN